MLPLDTSTLQRSTVIAELTDDALRAVYAAAPPFSYMARQPYRWRNDAAPPPLSLAFRSALSLRGCMVLLAPAALALSRAL